MSHEPQTPPVVSVSAKRASRGPIFLVLLAALLAGAWFVLDRRHRPVLIAGPMVQLCDEGRSFRIVWQAREWGSAAPAWFEQPLAVPQKVSTGPAALPLPERRGHSIDYAIANRGFLGRRIELSRASATRIDSPALRFLAFGDSGNGSNTQRALAELMIATNPDLVIHTGDVIYPAGAADDYPRNFFEPYRELLARVPFMPSLGNHDVATDKGQPYLDIFALPRNGPPGVEPERNYWFDYGPARFVALDTNRASERGAMTESDMRDEVAPWLRSVLSAAGNRWKFVFFHHPPYTGSTHPAEAQAFVKRVFVPVFDECDVNIVFCGHNHLYERTKPIRGDKTVPLGEGTVYIVTGAGGVSRYPEKLPPPEYMEYFNADVFSFTQVDLSPGKLELIQIDEQGKVIDRLTLQRDVTASDPAAAADAALSNPRPRGNYPLPLGRVEMR